MFSATTFVPFLEKLPSFLFKGLAQWWIDEKFPRHIFIELTTRCNLQCDFCPRPKVSDDIPFEIFKRIVGEASLFGKRSFSLHLFGEPLLYPRIIEAIKFLKKRGHTVIITTNGSLLSKFGRDLKDADKIIWSYKNNIKVPEHFKKDKRFIVRYFNGEDVGKWKRKEVRNYHNYGGEINSKSSSVQSVEKRYPCYHLWLAPAVAANGDILACCADPKKKLVLGNIKNCTLSQAWTSRELKEIRKEHLSGFYRDPCKNCDVWKSHKDIFFKWQYS